MLRLPTRPLGRASAASAYATLAAAAEALAAPAAACQEWNHDRCDAQSPFAGWCHGLAGAPAREVNGAALRWTPGPDELRLPECEDEHVPQTTVHVVATVNCFDGLRHWRRRLDVFVGFDQFVYWDPAYDSKTNPDNPPVAPDVYVAFGVANRHRRSYAVWEEGKPPDFVRPKSLSSDRACG